MSNPHPLATIYGIFTAVKAAVVTLAMVLLGAACLYGALYVARAGLRLLDADGALFSFWNIAAVICLGIALGLGFYGVNRIFEALPGITPRRIGDAPGRSRFATPKDLRRDRII